MRTSPPLSLWLIATFRPDASDSSFSSASVSASFSAGCGFGWVAVAPAPAAAPAPRPGAPTALLDDPLGQPGRILRRDQRAGVAGRQRAVDQHVADHVRQLQQPQRVGDMAAALADHLAEVGLGIAVLVDQLLVALRLFDRVEVGALDVLDDREFERGAVVDVADDAPASRSARRAAPRASAARRR